MGFSAIVYRNTQSKVGLEAMSDHLNLYIIHTQIRLSRIGKRDKEFRLYGDLGALSMG